MDQAGIEAFCLSLPGAVLDYPFGPTTPVFKVGGKMFAAMSLPTGLSFKASDMAYQILTENGLAQPAPYLARAKWVYLEDLAQWAAEDLKSHLEAAHGLIVARLPKRLRLALGLA